LRVIWGVHCIVIQGRSGTGRVQLVTV